MLVRDIMSPRVVTIDMDSSLSRVRGVFESATFHHLVVLEQGRIMGVVSDRDLRQHLSPFVGTMSERGQDLASLWRRVHQIMTRRPLTIDADADAAEAGRLMIKSGFGCLPCTNEAGELEGIITLTDFARVAIEMLEDMPDGARAGSSDAA